MTRNCHPDRTVEQVYEATVRKTQMLWQAGYTVIEKWECEYKEDKKTNPELQEFLKTYESVPLLNPRDSFFGGRTGATTQYAKADPNEIRYQDYTSLYPWVNKYCEYPGPFSWGYLNPADQDIDHYFGVAVVDVLPPRSSFIRCFPSMKEENWLSLCVVNVWKTNSRNPGWNRATCVLTAPKKGRFTVPGRRLNCRKPKKKDIRFWRFTKCFTIRQRKNTWGCLTGTWKPGWNWSKKAQDGRQGVRLRNRNQLTWELIKRKKASN